MNFYRSISMAIKSLLNNKVRSILTMFGIIVGIAAVMTIVSIVQGMKIQMINSYSAFGVNNINMYMYTENETMVNTMLDYCRNDLGEYITAISPNYQTNTTIRYRIKAMDGMVYFGNEYFDACTDRTIATGRGINQTDVKRYSKVCVIGETMRKEFFGAMSPIGQNLKINGDNYKIIGVYKAKAGGEKYSMDDIVLLPSSLMREVTGQRIATDYIVKAKDSQSTLTFTEKINAYMEGKYDPMWESFWAYSNQEWQEQESKVMDIISLVGGAIAGISLLVGGIGIMNIMLVSVTERTREIGIRMAIGAKRKDIIMQFVIEAAAVSATGGVIGIGFGYILTSTVGTFAMKFIIGTPQLVLPPVALTMGAFLFSVGIGIIFGIYPANKASKLQPVEALRAQ